MGRAEDGTARLLTNKLIRTYLSPYTDGQVQEALKLTLLYGILHVQQRYPGQVVGLEQLREAVRRCADARVLEDRLPALRAEIEALERQLLAFRSDVLQLEQRGELQPQQAVQDGGCRAAAEQGLPLPSDEPVLPPELAPEGPPAAAVYPAWWGDLPRPGHARRPAPGPRPPRPQPRLAYSVQPGEPAGAGPVDEDDLVTASYLAVAPRVSSRAAAAAAAAELEWGQQQEQAQAQEQEQQDVRVAGPLQGAAAHGASSSSQGCPRRPLQPAQSRVKQQLAATQQRHDARQRQRQQRLVAVINTASSAALTEPPAPAAAAADGAGDDSRPAQIAEQLLADPWTAWFMTPGRQRGGLQQQQQQQHAQAPLELELGAAASEQLLLAAESAASEQLLGPLPEADDVELGAGEELPDLQVQPGGGEGLEGERAELQEWGCAGGGELLRSHSLLVLPQQPGAVLQEADLNQGCAGGAAGRAPRGWAQAFDMSREALAEQQRRAAAQAAKARSSPGKPTKGWAAAYDMSRLALQEAAAAAAAPASALAEQSGGAASGWVASFDVSKESRAQAKRLLRDAHRQV